MEQVTLRPDELQNIVSMVFEKILPALRDKDERANGRHHPDGRGGSSGGGGSHSRDRGGRDGGGEMLRSERERDGAVAERPRSRSRERQDDRDRDRDRYGDRSGVMHHGHGASGGSELRYHGGRDGGTASRHSDRGRDGVSAEQRRSRSRGRDVEGDFALDRYGVLRHGNGTYVGSESRDRGRSPSYRDERSYGSERSDRERVYAPSSESRGRNEHREEEVSRKRESERKRLRELERLRERERERDRASARDLARARDLERERDPRADSYYADRRGSRGERGSDDAFDRRRSSSYRHDTDDRRRHGSANVSPERRRP